MKTEPKPIGYKGPGMCKACTYSVKRENEPMSFGYYGSQCRLVSRNCKGVK